MRRMGVFLLCAAWAFPALASAGETITYTYDAQGRLIQVDRAGTVNDGATAKYFYDDAESRTRVKVIGTGRSAPPSAPPQPSQQPRH